MEMPRTKGNGIMPPFYLFGIVWLIFYLFSEIALSLGVNKWVVFIVCIIGGGLTADLWRKLRR